jgi:hypothetical protein
LVTVNVPEAKEWVVPDPKVKVARSISSPLPKPPIVAPKAGRL